MRKAWHWAPVVLRGSSLAFLEPPERPVTTPPPHFKPPPPPPGSRAHIQNERCGLGCSWEGTESIVESSSIASGPRTICEGGAQWDQQPPGRGQPRARAALHGGGRVKAGFETGCRGGCRWSSNKRLGAKVRRLQTVGGPLGTDRSGAGEGAFPQGNCMPGHSGGCTGLPQPPPPPPRPHSVMSEPSVPQANSGVPAPHGPFTGTLSASWSIHGQDTRP